jgi:hypothetical protein
MSSRTLQDRSRCIPCQPLLRAGLAAALLAGACHDASAANRNPLGGGDSVTLEPVPESSPRAPSTRRRVFTCVTPELVIFSDRPCGPLPDVRELRLTPATIPPPGAGPARAGSATTSTRGDRAAASTARTSDRAERDEDTARREAQERASACERLEQAVRDLDQRLRTGYSAREAGRLWARWREARERLRDARC